MLSFTCRYLLLSCIMLGATLSAATAKDILGDWSVDGAATWELMKASPQFASIPPDQMDTVSKMMTAQMSSMHFTVTASTIISYQGKQKKEEAYTVTSIVDDVLTTQSTNASGKVETSTITVKKDSLVLASVDQPGMFMVLRHKVAGK